MGVVAQVKAWAVEEVLKLAEAHGWPAVDPELISARSIESPWGPGEEEWRAFCRWNTNTSIRYIIQAFNLGILPYKAPAEGPAPLRGRMPSPAPTWVPAAPRRNA